MSTNIELAGEGSRIDTWNQPRTSEQLNAFLGRHLAKIMSMEE